MNSNANQEETKVDLKYALASKRLKIAVKKYINRRTARSHTRMIRARERVRHVRARGRANELQVNPKTPACE